MAIPVIAVLDTGKTNKKLFLLDEDYQICFEKSYDLPETKDEDGFPCEDVIALSDWVHQSLQEIFRLPQFDIRAVNFSAYGASFVHLDSNGHVHLPLYNYLKPYPENMLPEFYNKYGGKTEFSLSTASPPMGNLNSGLQLYRLSKEKPALFNEIKFSLHLPEYLSYLLTQEPHSAITSIGCHTTLWDFERNNYHRWVAAESIDKKLAPVVSGEHVIPVSFHAKRISVGPGLHDSSAALIPYLKQFTDPFLLLSTGTWSISLNPFNTTSLTSEEIAKDCLCYLRFDGKPVKAARLFAGFAHQQQVERIGSHFHLQPGFHSEIKFDEALLGKAREISAGESDPIKLVRNEFFKYDLNSFPSAQEAYHQLIADLVQLQYLSSSLVLQPNVKRIFVDGGFSRNKVFMGALQQIFPALEIIAASVPQASAIGAALSIHSAWNRKEIPFNLVKLER